MVISQTLLTILKLLQAAGVDFGILYEGEKNAGNDVRRIGEEGLFEMLRDKNLASLQKAKFKSVVTTDPHSYNTLKNEYPWEEPVPILHFTELADQLVETELDYATRLVLVEQMHRVLNYAKDLTASSPPQ